jgi:O-acetyl-ADP-ribose deacetylase (regulator of RNase III)
MKAKVNKISIRIVHNTLLNLPVDAFVHATDPNLTLTQEMILRGGPTLHYECQYIGWCDIGAAVITTAGDLNFKKIIHAVGPRWGEGSERGKLANATRQTLHLAENNQLKSLALPAISTGILGYPVENCAKVMLTEIIDFTFEPVKHVRKILLCLENDLAYAAFVKEFQRQIKDLKASGEGQVKA